MFAGDFWIPSANLDRETSLFSCFAVTDEALRRFARPLALLLSVISDLKFGRRRTGDCEQTALAPAGLLRRRRRPPDYKR